MGQRCHCIGGIVGTGIRFIVLRRVLRRPFRVGAATPVLAGSLLDGVAVARYRGVVSVGCGSRVAAAAVHDLNQRRVVAVCASPATVPFALGAGGTCIVGRRVCGIQQVQVERVLVLVLFFRLLMLCRAARLAAVVGANELGERNIGRASHGAGTRRKHAKVAAASSTVLRVGGWMCSPDAVRRTAE